MSLPFHVRPKPDMTLADVRAILAKDKQQMLVDSADIKILTDSESGDRSIVFEAKDGSVAWEVPCTSRSVSHIAQWLGIPGPFARKIDHDIQEWLFHTMLDRPSREVLVSYTDEDIIAMEPPALDMIAPIKLVEIAERVLGEDALVLDAWISTKEYRFEAVVPFEDDDKIVAGLRFGHDTQHRLTPWVNLILYCPSNSNVFEIEEVTGDIDGRKETNADILIALEGQSLAAMDDADAQIHALGDLKKNGLGDPTQYLMRVGREQGLTSKLLSSAAEALPTLYADPLNPTAWDVVHTLANQATHSDVWGKANVRRKIEVACGAVIADHAARCPVCMSMIGGEPIHPNDLVPDFEE